VTCLREGTVALPDGRRLGFGEYGVRGGKPVLLFHGTPGGRQFDQDPAARDAGAWLFVLERPGFGLSDSMPGRRLLDWPSDVEVCADAFGLDHFSVVGFSGGAPYALACGYALPERVTLVGIVVGLVLFVDEPDLDHLVPDDMRSRLVRYRTDPTAIVEEIAEENRRQAASWAADPDTFFNELFGPVADSLAPFWKTMMASGFGRVPDVDEESLWYLPRGFPLEGIKPPIRGWYGDQDPLLDLAKELFRRIPSAKLTVYPGEGHFLNPVHRPDWLGALTDWT
jgi:pimeloyl-ACP methyl ester carboxylesterase